MSKPKSIAVKRAVTEKRKLQMRKASATYRKRQAAWRKKIDAEINRGEKELIKSGDIIPMGYITGLGRDHPYPKKAHLYKGTFDKPGLGMCKKAYNRGDGYSIWRNNIGEDGICLTCCKRVAAGKDPIPWPKGTN